MKTAKAVLDIARAQIGTAESPPNSNRQKYGAAYGWNGVAWCVQFVWWCFNEAGAADLLPIKTASCATLMDRAKAVGQWVTGNYRPGDVLIYNFGTSKKPQRHTGILESISGGILTAIEGNTAIGNNDNGGRVMRRNRKVSLVEGAFRPRYVEKPLSLIAQECMDGKWGNGETRRAKLAAAEYDAAAVQKLVNALCSGGISVRVNVQTWLTLRESPDKDSRELSRFGPGAVVRVTEVREGPGASAWGCTAKGLLRGWISMDFAVIL